MQEADRQLLCAMGWAFTMSRVGQAASGTETSVSMAEVYALRDELLHTEVSTSAKLAVRAYYQAVSSVEARLGPYGTAGNESLLVEIRYHHSQHFDGFAGEYPVLSTFVKQFI